MNFDEKIKHAKLLLNAVNQRYSNMLKKLFNKDKEKEVEQELDDFISSLAEIFQHKEEFTITKEDISNLLENLKSTCDDKDFLYLKGWLEDRGLVMVKE